MFCAYHEVGGPLAELKGVLNWPVRETEDSFGDRKLGFLGGEIQRAFPFHQRFSSFGSAFRTARTSCSSSPW